MSLGKETFQLNKTQFKDKIDRIIKNFRVNTYLIGESRQFVIRACSLVSRWNKLAIDTETRVYLRNIEIANGRRVKMLCLERGGTQQPISKSKLVDSLYPVKKIATSATPEEKHYNSVRSAMRNGISSQLKEFRENVPRPITCRITGKILRRGARTDVDHWGKPFAQIADDFVREQGLTYVDILLVGPPNHKRFKDQKLWDLWQLYHLENCQLSVVCASANRSKGSDGYTTPQDLIGSYESENEEDSLSLQF
jgi:hypothetical protein